MRRLVSCSSINDLPISSSTDSFRGLSTILEYTFFLCLSFKPAKSQMTAQKEPLPVWAFCCLPPVGSTWCSHIPQLIGQFLPSPRKSQLQSSASTQVVSVQIDVKNVITTQLNKAKASVVLGASCFTWGNPPSPVFFMPFWANGVYVPPQTNRVLSLVSV